MCTPRGFLFAATYMVAAQSAFGGQTPGLGQPISEADIAPWAITVFPSGRGLPPGSGTAVEGAKVYETKCAACHGDAGQGGLGPVLISDRKRQGIDESTVTIPNYWPYATTVYDYVRRAMPWQSPRSTSDQEAWDLTAFILEKNHLIPPNSTIDARSLPLVKMPNRDGFIPAFPKLLPAKRPVADRAGH